MNIVFFMWHQECDSREKRKGERRGGEGEREEWSEEEIRENRSHI